MLEILPPQAVLSALCPSTRHDHDRAVVERLKLLAMRFEVTSDLFRLSLSEKCHKSLDLSVQVPFNTMCLSYSNTFFMHAPICEGASLTMFLLCFLSQTM